MKNFQEKIVGRVSSDTAQKAVIKAGVKRKMNDFQKLIPDIMNAYSYIRLLNVHSCIISF